MNARNADRRTPSKAHLRRLIMLGNLLAEAARGQQILDPSGLADAWDNSVEALRADLAEPRMVLDPRTRGMPSIETIGTCEGCGATDHHLILGLCPSCTEKTGPQHLDCTRRCTDSAQVASEVPLGAEADVSHVLVPKGRAR